VTATKFLKLALQNVNLLLEGIDTVAKVAHVLSRFPRELLVQPLGESTVFFEILTKQKLSLPINTVIIQSSYIYYTDEQSPEKLTPKRGQQ
jgi:hypothetical protein